MRLPPSTPTISPHSNARLHLLLPLGLFSAAWAAIFYHLNFPFSEASQLHAAVLLGPLGGGFHFGYLLLGLFLGVCWQGALRFDGKPLLQAGVTLGLFIALAAFPLLLNMARGIPLLAMGLSGGMAAYGVGCAAGIALYGLLGRWLAPKLEQFSGAGLLWAIVTWLPVIFLLLPWESMGLAKSDGGYFAEIAQRYYALIKAAMLWAPVGVVFVLLERQAVLRRWGVAALISYFLVALGLPDMVLQWRDTLEIWSAFPGMAAGIWLGERTLGNAFSMQAAAGQGVSAASQLSMPSSLGRKPAHHPRHRSRRRARTANHGGGVLLGASRILSIVLLLGVGVALIDFPRWGALLAGGFLVYLALLWRYPNAWLLILPAALPLFDLAFWTGRFFLDEFDLLLAVTLAALLWRAPGRRIETGFSPPYLLIFLLGASVLISGGIGLFPLQALDANAFAAYWSHYNSLRVAKGFMWGVILFFLLRPCLSEARLMKLFSAGMLLGLAGVASAALWEYWRFSGSSAPDYRVTATFSSMHIGGGHIEAYLVFALPFAWIVLWQEKRTWIKAAAMAVFLLAIYAVITTVARGGIVALAVVFAVLALGVYRSLRAQGLPRALRYTANAILVGGAVLLVAGLSTATFLQQRFTQTEADAQTRFAHWTQALSLLQNNWSEQLFGAGLGAFPERYLYGNFDTSMGSYRYQTEGDKRYLSLNSGGTLYMAQPVAVSSGTLYSLELEVRSNDQTKQLDVSICEKKLFNSHLCQWLSVPVAPGAGWQRRSLVFSSGQVGQGAWWLSRPVQLSLFNPQDKGVVDVDAIRLLDPGGANLISNGDFTQGGDFWFFKSGNHLPWHIKNMWVHLTFEQGLVGLAIFCALTIVALWRLGRRWWAGDPLATAWLAGTGGLLTIGFVDSLLDAPRLALLLVLALLVGAAHHARRSAGRA
ncbi:MAG: O-antigen ligase family protein [Hydrogenophilales bacterium]|nr:O-antigen ligase family protein [Hydrogenophilales bacterium]